MKTLSQLLCILLLLVTGCIGSNAKLNTPAYKDGAPELDALLHRIVIGMTRDELIVRYGPPNRTATLDSGKKLMQYNRKRSFTDRFGIKQRLNCELRLWLVDAKVQTADYLGDQEECLRFLVDARHEINLEE